MTKILITGSKGQLGTEIKELSAKFSNLQFFFTDIEELDISSLDAISNYLKDKQISYIVNCAAYTNVDQAEENEDAARLINADAVKNLATAASQNNITLIHISTDYVFSGDNSTPYTEDQKAKPMGVYGRTKFEGEENVRSTCKKHIIIRTSWLYSPFGKNFLKTMLRLGKEKDSLGVVSDQIGTPTYAHDLASAIIRIIESIDKNSKFNDFGTYHYSNEGVCSWYDFATEIQNTSKNKCKINSIESMDFQCLAKRPHYSVLNKSKIKHIFTIEIPHWRSRIEHCIKRITE
ncbi:dTDP-4-dehydrorhamnose reductase [Labilibaculum sp. A4]|uniref:dTDP-4-dehydrorhamnose reductase n=1 Tax=Labilibaculum euxinus TaxID=2686357 RepID=A0A425YEP6_9BACT|nr:dTDP-4-dehydrorhamnose reductase [Labilibaculum euxinus]MDQ1772946.1 dTDP-4-dehydrorhamnose reductase [Labilibaculum euxinus]MUP39936.1 dTDP-4-dehydrorhamnose reductase [Labilibaculum euxinus]MVB09141.1 dTDP-4-dehydrorhamnose reductase [Labilibaculum euxinus]MWN75739.1 dTDP-4-dehydrorhamnose reductase [Labilibaculum euxinus]